MKMKKKKSKTSPFTLAQTWKYCLQMWKDVADEYEKYNQQIFVSDLKTQWIKNHGFCLQNTWSDCFFCDYANRQKDTSCKTDCPGALVAPHFFCGNSAYNYSTKPRKFYQKLLRMDKKRRKK